nr:MAG TPA: hypothetical protein [Caudoviricetes sp.]
MASGTITLSPCSPLLTQSLPGAASCLTSIG